MCTRGKACGDVCGKAKGGLVRRREGCTKAAGHISEQGLPPVGPCGAVRSDDSRGPRNGPVGCAISTAPAIRLCA
jgi:hypothetical protein